MNQTNSVFAVSDGSSAAVVTSLALSEKLGPLGVYQIAQWAPPEHLRAERTQMANELGMLMHELNPDWGRIAHLEAAIEAIPLSLAVPPQRAPNTVVDVGANYLLDNFLAGTSFTATFYLGLITNTGFTGIVASDTAASHAGWAEASGYSSTTRPSAVWQSAVTRSKSLTGSGLAYTMNASDNIVGAFLTTSNLKGGSVGTLFSAGSFSGGVQPVISGNILTVQYQLSC